MPDMDPKMEEEKFQLNIELCTGFVVGFIVATIMWSLVWTAATAQECIPDVENSYCHDDPLNKDWEEKNVTTVPKTQDRVPNKKEQLMEEFDPQAGTFKPEEYAREWNNEPELEQLPPREFEFEKGRAVIGDDGLDIDLPGFKLRLQW